MLIFSTSYASFEKGKNSSVGTKAFSYCFSLEFLRVGVLYSAQRARARLGVLFSSLFKEFPEDACVKAFSF